MQLRGCKVIFEARQMLSGDKERMKFGLQQVLFDLVQKVSDQVLTVLIQRNLGLDCYHISKRHSHRNVLDFNGQFVLS